MEHSAFTYFLTLIFMRNFQWQRAEGLCGAQLHNKNHMRVREACQDTMKQLRLDYLVRAPAPCQWPIYCCKNHSECSSRHQQQHYL